MDEYLLEAKDLSVTLYTERGELRVVDGVSFRLKKRETLGIVGESGCGKSMTANSILRMVPAPGKISGGQIIFKGRDLSTLPERKLRSIRGKEIAMVFQEPMTSLNPLMTCGRQITEALRAHEKTDAKQAKRHALELIRLVGIPMAERIYESTPSGLSGGMRQRIVIAMALCNNPDVLICDEPTTALDVTVQAQILRLIDELKSSFGSAVLFITHDMGVIQQMTDRVMVMYSGQAVEYLQTEELFRKPLHPYTQGLIACIPGKAAVGHDLPVIKGTVPTLYALPKGCLFAPRCPYATKRCRCERPGLYGAGRHLVRCFQYEHKEASNSAADSGS